MNIKRGSLDRSISNSKKAQVTVFIIIGILLLFAFAGILFLVKSTKEDSLTAAGDPVIVDAPQEFLPIQRFTENCLLQKGKRGLILLGQQGGYIDPNIVGEYSADNPSEADGIDLEPMKVPYWHYNPLPNEGKESAFRSLQPKLIDDGEEGSEFSIESQLRRFVAAELEECLGEYKVFKDSGFNIERESGKDVLVRIGEDTVGFLLKMEFSAGKGEREHSFEKFYVKLPIALKKYYQVASDIALVEYNYSILEKQALDLIQSYGRVDVSTIPPTSAVAFEMAPTAFWVTDDIKRKFKGMLMSNVPMMQLAGANNFHQYQYPVTDLSSLFQANYDNQILDISNPDGLTINFDYFGWEPYFNLNDKGGELQPDHLAVHRWFLHFGIQEYIALYDISYPVLVTIRDNQAFDGEGYNFVTALEANIRNNRPLNPELEVLELELPERPAQSLLCNRNQRDTELVKSVVVDSYTKEPVEAVNIAFTIPEQETCEMGATDEEGELNVRYPAAYGGVVSFMKDDYLTNFYPVDTYLHKERPGIIGYAIAEVPEPAMEINRIKPINVTIKKKLAGKCIEPDCYTSSVLGGGELLYSFLPEPTGSNINHTWSYIGSTASLTNKESGVVTLKRIKGLKDGVFNEEFIAAVSVKGSERQEILLVPGVYEVTGLVILEGPVIFPEEERCSPGILEAIGCGDIDGCCSIFDEQNMDKLVSGQLNWEEEGHHLTITPEDLYGSNEITFYIPTMDILSVPEEPGVRVIEDMQMMGKLGEASKIPSIKNTLKPKYSLKE